MDTRTASASTSSIATNLDLNYSFLRRHIQRLIKEEQDANPNASTSSHKPPQQFPSKVVVNQTQDITEALDAAFRANYPLQDWHKPAIRRYIEDVMQALQATAYTASHSSGANTPTPPSASRTNPIDNSPTLLIAEQAARSARQLDSDLWNRLCQVMHHALETRRKQLRPGQQRSSPLQQVTNILVTEFLTILDRSRTTLKTLYSHLQSVSLEFDDCASYVIGALDRLLQDDLAPTIDEAVGYVIYRLPAANSNHDRSDHNPELEHHFAAQLRRTYYGDAPLRFLKFVLDVEKNLTRPTLDGPTFLAHFKGTPIVQSSGTGKTRMVLELGGLAPLLYVCVRSRKPSQTPSIHSGYPLTEENLYEFFYHSTYFSTASCDLQVAVFIGAYFEELVSRLQSCNTPEEKYASLTQLNDFGGAGEEQRNPFFHSVITSARIKLDNALQASTSASTDRRNVFAIHLDHAACKLSEQLRQVQQHLHRKHSAFYEAHQISKVPVFVAFDECVQLIIQGPASHYPNHQLDSLRRAWHHLLELEQRKDTVTYWLVLIDTNTGAATLIEPEEHQALAPALGKKPLPIFVGLDYDVMRSEAGALTSPGDVCRASQVCSYGRPLWTSLPSEELWDVAQLKMLGDKKFEPFNLVLSYNILASRLALQVVSHQFGESFGRTRRKVLATESVHWHMRILRDVVDHAGLTVDSPSEPVLALAASMILLRSSIKTQQDKPATAYATVIDTFRRHWLATLDAQCLRGSKGEFIARLALMATWDAVKLADLPNAIKNRRGPEFFSLPIRLQSFLDKVAILDSPCQTLLQEQLSIVFSTVAKRLDARCQPDCKEPVEAWINFSHFDVLPQGISEISPDYLWYCWKRGVALQMAHGQTGIDGIIPVFVGRLSQKFKVDRSSDNKADAARADTQFEQGDIDDIDEAEAARQMTYIAWEAKFREGALASEDASRAALAGPHLLNAACDAAVQTPQEPLTPCGLLTILADLGTSQSFKGTNGQRPHLDKIQPGHGRPDFIRLWIRGTEDPSAYPCFDDLGIRGVVDDLCQKVDRTVVQYEEYNKMMLPLSNPGANPEAQQRVSEKQPAIVDWPSPFRSSPEVASEQPMDLDNTLSSAT